MGIFQQQFNSLLSSALRTSIAGNVEKVVDWSLSTDKALQEEMTAAHRESLPNEYAKHFTNMVLKAQDYDVMSMDAETLGEVSSTLTGQARQIAEQQRGIDAQKATTIGMINKLMSQGHAKRSKTLAKWKKDLTGGNE